MKVSQMFLIILLSSATSCTSFRWKANGPIDPVTKVETPLPPMLNARKNKLPAFMHVQTSQTRANHFWITNRSKEMIHIDYSKSVVIVNGTSYRVVSGKTKVLHSDLQTPAVPIAPGTDAQISLYTEDKDVNNELLDGAPGILYRIAYNTESESKIEYAIVHSVEDKLQVFQTPIPENERLICFLTGFYCLMIKPTDQDKDFATKEGQRLFGPTAISTYLGRGQ